MRPRRSPSPHLRLWWNISFSTPGTAPESRLTSKSAPIFVTGKRRGLKVYLKKKKLAGCCVIPPRCSPKPIGVKARRRELSAATECSIIKRTISARTWPAPVSARTLTRLKILSYILKVSSLSRTGEALKEAGKRQFGDGGAGWTSAASKLVPLASRFRGGKVNQPDQNNRHTKPKASKLCVQLIPSPSLM